MQTSRYLSCSWRRVRYAVVAVALLASPSLKAQLPATVTISLDPGSARTTAIPSDFLGISIEMSNIISTGGTTPFLNGSSTTYSAMLRRIGVKSIRIGGNTSEAGTYPANSDAANVNNFAQMTGTNLIWTLPVESNYNVITYSNFAGALLTQQVAKGDTFSTTFEIGNEPDLHSVDQPTYQARFDAYNFYLRTNINCGITTTGPSAASNKTYVTDMATDSTYSGSLHSTIGFMTMHWYPVGGAGDFSNASSAIAAMLSSSLPAKYLWFYNTWANTVAANGFLPRMEETNSIYNGGYPGASNSYAAALWGMDYLSYLAQNTALAGVNMHEGNTAYYNPISPTTYASSYTLNGVGYGIFAFNYANQGRPVPVTMSNPSGVNLTAYATLLSDGSESMHIINKTYSSTAADVTVQVSPGSTYGNAEIMYLKQMNSDPTSNSGITLGGQPVNGDGSWTGGYTSFITPTAGVFTISVPHMQAAVIRFHQ